MANATRPRSLRGEIENVLARKVGGVQVAGTAKWLAAEVRESSLTAVEIELKKLAREGKVTTRTMPRSGELLWKLTDKHHQQWAALAGPGTDAGRRNWNR